MRDPRGQNGLMKDISEISYEGSSTFVYIDHFKSLLIKNDTGIAHRTCPTYHIESG